MGMQAWWIFAAGVTIAWVFWRLRADPVDARRAAARSLAAEEALRERFARGEIEEDELAARMAAVRASREG